MHMDGDCNFLLTIFTEYKMSCHITIPVWTQSCQACHIIFFASLLSFGSVSLSSLSHNKADLSWGAWYLIAQTLLMWLSQRVLLNDFTDKSWTRSSKTFHLLVEPENNTYILYTIPKNEIVLLHDLAMSHRVRLRLWHAHGIYKALRFISRKQLCTPLCFSFILEPLS
jgi:hypothetical protein